MYVRSNEFDGCCGAVTWYLNYKSGSDVVASLKRQADQDKGCFSLALVILIESQKTRLDKSLKKMGFKLHTKGIRNVNTGHNLYLYSLNLNTYKRTKMKRRSF